jgi:hypothetical protein
MRRVALLVGAMLLYVVALSAIFLAVGCAGGGSQGAQQDHTTHHPHTGNVKLDLHPEGDSGVSGTASIEDTSGGVVVKLELRNLPKPNTLYLAHIHPGTCADEGEGYEHSSAHGEEGHTHHHGEESGHAHGASAHEHGASAHEHGGSAEIEYPHSRR